MARQRSSFALVLIGIFWLAIAVVWGIQVYDIVHGRTPVILTYGLSALVAGLFLGRAMAQIRTPKPPTVPPATNIPTTPTV